MKLIFIYGTPAVGKLTVAEELAAITGFKLFHNHLTVDLALALFDFGTPPFGRYVEHLCLEVFETAAREGIVGLIFTFVYAYAIDDEFIRQVVKIVKNNGGVVCFVQLISAREELERRVLADSRQRFRKIKTVEELQDILTRYELFKPIPFAQSLTIDTTHLSPQDAARMIVKHYLLDHISDI
jgi:hypothetical protein